MNRHGNQVGHAQRDDKFRENLRCSRQPSREDDTRPASHIEKPSTIRGEAQHGRQRTRTDFTATSPPTTFSPGGQLTAVIDFGTSGTGDPACDTVIAWTDLDAVSRVAYRRALHIDNETWVRGRGSAPWKALITLVNQLEHNDGQGAASSRTVINRTVSDLG